MSSIAAGTRTKELEKVLRELEFRMAITTAMLSTLDLDYILYVILSGITSGDGLGFNRAVLFLDDDDGRSLKVTLAVGPGDEEDAVTAMTHGDVDGDGGPNLIAAVWDESRGQCVIVHFN